MKAREFLVYRGFDSKNIIVYIGTTVQEPETRFRYHRHKGLNLRFEVIHKFDTADEMLDKEFELITELKPKYNKITHRRQNLNIRLTNEEIKKRVGDKEWCQTCLKRRVTINYTRCKFC